MEDRVFNIRVLDFLKPILARSRLDLIFVEIGVPSSDLTQCLAPTFTTSVSILAFPGRS